MKKRLFFLKTNKLLLIAALIHFSFYISAAWTRWYDYFFFATALHLNSIGMDFFQVPKGAFSFLNFDNLVGEVPEGMLSFAKDYAVNINVYHPLFTVAVGCCFLLFSPIFSFYLWMLLKLPITIFVAFYLLKRYGNNKNTSFAIFIFLANLLQYIDIRISQYQFLLNLFVLFFLIYLLENKSNWKSGIFYFLSLLVKPIGLVWLPVLLIRKKIKTIIFGIGLFAYSTAVFLFHDYAQYYYENLFSHFSRPFYSKAIDFMSLGSVLNYSFPTSLQFIIYLKYIFFFLILFLAFFKKIHFLKIFYLLLLFFLFFYDFVFQYHYSILVPVLVLGLIFLEDFQTRLSKILIVLFSFPISFIMFRLGGYFINQSENIVNPSLAGWQIISTIQISILVLLTFSIFLKDIKRLFSFIKNRI